MNLAKATRLNQVCYLLLKIHVDLIDLLDYSDSSKWRPNNSFGDPRFESVSGNTELTQWNWCNRLDSFFTQILHLSALTLSDEI